MQVERINSARWNAGTAAGEFNGMHVDTTSASLATCPGLLKKMEIFA